MLTSNIIKHLKQQKWGSALIDFIVVVSGIFVALQVDSWHEARTNTQKEKVILEQLYNDFSINVDNINTMATFHQKKAEDLDYVIDIVASNQIDSATKRANNALMSMFQLPPINVSMGTYKYLIASGDIALIQDQHLKTKIMELESHLDVETSMLAYFRQLNNLEIDYTRGLISVQANVESKKTYIKVDFSRFSSDDNLLTIVANQERNHLIFARVRSELAQHFDQVKSYIDNRLKRSKNSSD